MGLDSDRKRLSQAKMPAWLQRDLQMNEMITVYHLSDREGAPAYDVYCALIPSDQIERVLSDPNWDLSFRDGIPCANMCYEGGEEHAEYLRYGVKNGIEPLIMNRSFDEMRDGYREISEEFRLFHNLYHDRKTDKYIKIDDAGHENVVAVVEPNRVQIRLKEIRQFLAIKEMYLSIQFNRLERSRHSLKELGLKTGERDHRDDLRYWRHHYGDFDSLGNAQAFSRLWGKRLIKPLPKSKSGMWGFAEEPEQKHVEFIIGVDENGDEITYTSDPDALANYFDANPSAPHHLTPVHFRKQVLDKYDQQPSKYTVEDAFLRCGSLWGMDIDNHHADSVCAWLGDLGRDLPYAEQLHWRAHNIPPAGGVSQIHLKRQILAESANSAQPDHLFKQRYRDLQAACKESLGWHLLLPLDIGDEYHFKSLRLPAADEQRDFDELVLSLAKILIDSLNERRLNTLIPDEQKAELKGSIARLDAVLSSRAAEGAADHIVFLRKLQSLRSSRVAHRKGRNYQKIAVDFGIESQSLRDVFTQIVRRALGVLDYFILLVRSGQIDLEIIKRNSVKEGYAILNEMVGFCESDQTDGSVNHDEVIYELRSKP